MLSPWCLEYTVFLLLASRIAVFRIKPTLNQKFWQDLPAAKVAPEDRPEPVPGTNKGRGGPVEPATVVTVKARSTEGIVDVLASGQVDPALVPEAPID